MSAWGMGGTIRAAINLAGYLAAAGWEVEIISVVLRRAKPFFPIASAITVTGLDDRRPNALPRVLRPLHRALRAQPSVLVDRVDRGMRIWNLWTDVMLAKELRGRTGFLVTTRPGLNLLAAHLAPPGMITVGLEQVNLQRRRDPLREAMARRYKRLAALVVLTQDDRQRY